MEKEYRYKNLTIREQYKDLLTRQNSGKIAYYNFAQGALRLAARKFDRDLRAGNLEPIHVNTIDQLLESDVFDNAREESKFKIKTIHKYIKESDIAFDAQNSIDVEKLFFSEFDSLRIPFYCIFLLTGDIKMDKSGPDIVSRENFEYLKKDLLEVRSASSFKAAVFLKKTICVSEGKVVRDYKALFEKTEAILENKSLSYWRSKLYQLEYSKCTIERSEEALDKKLRYLYDDADLAKKIINSAVLMYPNYINIPPIESDFYARRTAIFDFLNKGDLLSALFILKDCIDFYPKAIPERVKNVVSSLELQQD